MQAVSTFSPRSDPAFGDARPALRRLLADAKPRPAGPQHFCAIGYRAPGSDTAWIHWRESNRLILWLGRGDGSAREESLIRSPRQLDLASDVVASEADLAGSTYRVTRGWLAALLGDCAAHGDDYQLEI